MRNDLLLITFDISIYEIVQFSLKSLCLTFSHGYQQNNKQNDHSDRY